MNRSILRNELYLGRRSFLTGGLVLLLTVGMFVAFTETVTKNEGIKAVVGAYPPALLEAFHIDVESFSSFEGWMGSEPFIFYTLILGSIAAMWASTSIAREVDQRTGELVFALPISRKALFFSKVLTHFIYVTMLAVAAALVAMVGGALLAEMHRPFAVLLVFAAGYLISLVYASVGFALTPLFASERAAISAGIGVAILSFVFHSMAQISEGLGWVGNLSPMSLFDPHKVATDESLPAVGVLVCIGLYVAGIGLGLQLFSRKNLAG